MKPLEILTDSKDTSFNVLNKDLNYSFVLDTIKIPDSLYFFKLSKELNSFEGLFKLNQNISSLFLDNHQNIYKSQIKKLINSDTDILITSGAVSAGKYDYIPSIVRTFKLSNYFKSVAIRPGKPILFAKIKGKQKAIFGLPGNPMSSSACFRFFVIPFMKNILGLSEEQPIRATLKNSFSKKQNFTRFAKSKLSTTKNGKIEVEILQGQESFRVKSFVKSNIWSLLPAGKSKFKKGDILDCFFPNHSNQTLI